jgi:hypothetical protein
VITAACELTPGPVRLHQTRMSAELWYSLAPPSVFRLAYLALDLTATTFCWHVLQMLAFESHILSLCKLSRASRAFPGKRGLEGRPAVGPVPAVEPARLVRQAWPRYRSHHPGHS